jgi:Leucine-rich repeat (LRR) protein
VSFTPISDVGLGLVLPSLQALESLSAVRCPVQGRGLEPLTTLPNLTMLDLSRCKQLATLPALPTVRRLLINDCPRLQSLQSLAASVSLSDVQWSFSSLGYNLSQVTSINDELHTLHALPSIRVLNLARAKPLTAQALVFLGQMTQLQELDLSFCQITMGCMRSLKSVPLTTLKLSHTTLSESDLKEIADISSLEILDLSYVQGIGNNELIMLSGLDKLRYLNLYNHLHVSNLDAKNLLPQTVVLQTHHQLQLCGFMNDEPMFVRTGRTRPTVPA